jgi:hypothetical protein
VSIQKKPSQKVVDFTIKKAALYWGGTYGFASGFSAGGGDELLRNSAAASATADGDAAADAA